jgi:hypothetical protein
MSEITKLADIQAAVRQYAAYAKEANEIINKMQGRLSYYDNQKSLNDYQQKSKKEAEQTVIAFSGLLQAGKAIVTHFEFQEGEAWESVARSSAQNLEYAEIMHQKYSELSKENEELRELLQSFIRDLAA